MQLVVLANDEQWNELAVDTEEVQWIRASLPFAAESYPDAAAFFLLDITGSHLEYPNGKPVFINSMLTGLSALGAPPAATGINGWSSFLKRPLWEITGNCGDDATGVLKKINKQYITVKDEPGLVAGRVVAMIINEAYFAWGDAVSDKAAIDTAMKLGTNYPYGPFEWAEKIGLKNIYTLLATLGKTDNRYTPAPALVKEISAKQP
ncbi:MAG: 3-hydroxyacyl-CoA dehydrogenase family protein [Ferruginibacter sp.]